MLNVRLDLPETEDWIKPDAERAKSANRKRLRSGGDHGDTGSPTNSRGRRLEKHAYQGSDTHSTGTGQEVHGGGGGPTKILYHLTDNPKFEPDPNIDPPENALSILTDERKGIYLTENIEHWVNGYGYVRPFVAEMEVDEDAFTLATTPGGGQVFLPAENFGAMKVKRVIPIDEWAREKYGDYGWVESYFEDFHEGEGGFGVDAKPWVPAPLGHDYRYEGPDVRDMPKEETDRLAERTEQYRTRVEKHAATGAGGNHPSGSSQKAHGGDGGGDTPETDYRWQHQPSALYGAPAHDLSVLMSDQVYDSPHWYFSTHEPYSREGLKIIQDIRGKPDAEVTIYRAVPAGVTEINPGDWVTQVQSYARIHGESNIQRYDIDGPIGPGFTILSRTVTAKELVWPGDSPVEFGWFPDNPFVDNPDATLEDIEDFSKRIKFSKRKTNKTPGFPHGPSIKWPKVYEALRRDGKSKSDAAAISNAHWNKYRRWGRAGSPGPKSAAEYERTRGRKARKRKGIPLPKSRQRSIVKHPWQGSEIHSTGTDQSVHGTGTTGPAHTDTSTPYGHAKAHADDLLDMEIVLNGEHYSIDGTEVPDTPLLTVAGDLFNPEGDDVGDFAWTSNESYPEWSKLELITIDASERGSGLGLTVIREWERRLGEVGFEGMELQADAMGKYFWAVYGYGWELGSPPDRFLDHVRRSIARPTSLTATVRAMSSGSGDTWPDTFPQAHWDQLAAVAASPDSEPIDFASIGAVESNGDHLGKAIMLTADPWNGVKDISS